jgi:hypothetical protein
MFSPSYGAASETVIDKNAIKEDTLKKIPNFI